MCDKSTEYKMLLELQISCPSLQHPIKREKGNFNKDVKRAPYEIYYGTIDLKQNF